MMSWQLADALLDALQVLFGLHHSAVHVFMYVHVTHALGEPCRKHSPLVARSYVDVSNLLFTSCSNGSFLECLPPTVEAVGLIPGRDMSVSGPLV